MTPFPGLETRAARVLEYRERVRARRKLYFFFARTILLFLLAEAFWETGLSRVLAHGLRGWFSGSPVWPLTHIFFIAFSIFAYEIVLFPVSYFEDLLSPGKGPDAGPAAAPAFGAWLLQWTLSLLIETILVTAAGTAIYTLMWLQPNLWWLSATALYAAIFVGLSVWGPSILLPRVKRMRPVQDPDLLGDLQRLGEKAGLRIQACVCWEIDDPAPHSEVADAPLRNVVLAGVGRHRTVVFTADFLHRHSRREQLFLAARRMAGHKGGADVLAYAVQILLVGLMVWGASRWMTTFALQRGISDPFQPEVFPVWVAILFVLATLIGFPLHALKRHLALRCDTFALTHAGGLPVLAESFRRQFETAPFAYHATIWQIIFYDTPTPEDRLRHAKSLAARHGHSACPK